MMPEPDFNQIARVLADNLDEDFTFASSDIATQALLAKDS